MSRDDTYLVDILQSAKIALDYVAGNHDKRPRGDHCRAMWTLTSTRARAFE
jgi:hypothetical protein